MLKRIIQKHLPTHWHGIAFDLVFVVLNFTLLPFLGSNLQQTFDGSFREDDNSFLIITFLVVGLYFWRLLGLILKRIPFKKRLFLEKNYDGDDGCGVAGCIWFLGLGTSLLGMAFLLMSVLILLKNSGIADYTQQDNLIGFVGLSIVILDLYLFYRLFKAPTKEEIKVHKQQNITPNESVDSPIEIFADLGLFGYMFLWQAFYNYFMSTVVAPNAFQSILMFVGVFILSIFVFIFFYIGPRSVFLFEDAKYAWTWLTIPLVFISSMISHLFF